MKKRLFLSFILSVFILTSASAQKDIKVFTSKFHYTSVTYNASPNPNECWEAAEFGLQVKTDRSTSFFKFECKEVEKLQTKIGEKEVQIEVHYYDGANEGSGAQGNVTKITLKGEVIFTSIEE